MNKLPAVILAFLFFSLFSFCQQIQPLDLATRVGYQRAIEEVYWQQRIWPQQNPAAKPPLGAVISVDQLQAKAEDGLRLFTATMGMVTGEDAELALAATGNQAACGR